METIRRVRNRRPWPVDAIVEPWGERIPLGAGRALRLVIRSQVDVELEIVRRRRTLAIYLPEGTTLDVFRGRELVVDLNIEFPVGTLPEGLKISDFVEKVFGGPGQPSA